MIDLKKDVMGTGRQFKDPKIGEMEFFLGSLCKIKFNGKEKEFPYEVETHDKLRIKFSHDPDYRITFVKTHGEITWTAEAVFF